MNMCIIEGMGSEIPIKIAGELKAMKWVLSYAGESCFRKVFLQK